jgi:hypothetical protein
MFGRTRIWLGLVAYRTVLPQYQCAALVVRVASVSLLVLPPSSVRPPDQRLGSLAGASLSVSSFLFIKYPIGKLKSIANLY